MTFSTIVIVHDMLLNYLIVVKFDDRPALLQIFKSTYQPIPLLEELILLLEVEQVDWTSDRWT